MALRDGCVDEQQKALVEELELTALAETPGRRAVRLALRFGPVLLVLAVVAVLIGSGALKHVSLDALRANAALLQAYVRTHPVLSVGAYLAAYVLCIALSLPVALVLTVSGGFLFGPWLGGPTAALGCTLGATIVFLISRLAVGDAVEARTGPRVRAIAEGIRKDAFFYLLTLRLIPVTPFWLANVAAGLIAIPVPVFVAATFLGILPTSLIYAGLGSGLGRLFDSGQPVSAHSLVTPQMILPLAGLALLSVLPIIYQRYRARRSA
jgi:uncharacterized membrane protein YdjX (TVP38/TMEM64 family)